MPTELEKKSWTIDQVTKSEFFHGKLHEWGLLEIAYELELVKGEELEWDRFALNISKKAWNKVIHRGIKPVIVFAHPDILKENPRRVAYYRTLAMVSIRLRLLNPRVSQKSMGKVGLPVEVYESGQRQLSDNRTSELTKHFNKIISILVEQDEEIDAREFDLWRGMAAGSQAQGSWQNAKGDKAEIFVKAFVERRLREKGLTVREESHGESKVFHLKDGRIIKMGDEPDIGIYQDKVSCELIEVATEIKGGIGTGGIFERFGATLKSLQRAKQENENSVTVLILQKVSLTETAREEMEQAVAIDHLLIIEDLIDSENAREALFKLLKL